jgi:hypothetical protein
MLSGDVIYQHNSSPLFISDVKEVVGISETKFKDPSIYTNYDIFRALIHLKDGRYCYFDAWKKVDGDWEYMGTATFSKNLKALVLPLSTSQVDSLKLHHLL